MDAALSDLKYKPTLSLSSVLHISPWEILNKQQMQCPALLKSLSNLFARINPNKSQDFLSYCLQIILWKVKSLIFNKIVSVYVRNTSYIYVVCYQRCVHYKLTIS